jgi:hypothetical protein
LGIQPQSLPPSTARYLAGDKVRPAAKKSTAWATSSTLPLRRMGVLAAKCAGLAWASLSVQLNPSRRDAVDAHLGRKGLGHRLGEHVQSGLRCAVVCMAGPGAHPSQRADVHDPSLQRSADAASASRATRNGPRALVSKTASHWSRLSASSGADSKTAALLTTMSSRPKRPTTAATAARTEASERTSHSTANARRPRLSISRAVSSGLGLGAAVGDGHIRARPSGESQRNRTANAPRAAGHQCRFAAEWLSWNHRFKRINNPAEGNWLVGTQGFESAA